MSYDYTALNKDPYYDKYMKYKNKYVILRNQLLGGASEDITDWKVLIVVDVQKCFFEDDASLKWDVDYKSFLKEHGNNIVNYITTGIELTSIQQKTSINKEKTIEEFVKYIGNIIITVANSHSFDESINKTNSSITTYDDAKNKSNIIVLLISILNRIKDNINEEINYKINKNINISSESKSQIEDSETAKCLKPIIFDKIIATYKNKYTASIAANAIINKESIENLLKDDILNKDMNDIIVCIIEYVRLYVKAKYKAKLNKLVNKQDNKYQLIVFTQDMHPKHHISHSVLAPHCISGRSTECFDHSKISPYTQNREKPNNDKYNADLKIDKQHTYNNTIIDIPEHRGIEYFSNNIIRFKKDFIEKMSEITNFKNWTNNIEKDTTDTKVEETSTNEFNSGINRSLISRSNNIEQNKMKVSTKFPVYLELYKGELCNFDAYSGFIYHIYYTDKGTNTFNFEIKDMFNENTNENISDYNNNLNKYSTGLAESILDYIIAYKNKIASEKYKNDMKNSSKSIKEGIGQSMNLQPTKSLSDYINKDINLEINVCGLVTNICVVNSCIGGLKIFEYYNTHNFHDSYKLSDFKITLLNEYSLRSYSEMVPSVKQVIDNAKYNCIEVKQTTETIDDKFKIIYIDNTAAADDHILQL